MPKAKSVVIETPKWAFWSQRPTIGLRTAIAMVHNFRGTDHMLRALKTADDGRWDLFEDDLRTARKWLGLHPLLLPARPGPVPDSRDLQDRCEVVLAHFVEWVRIERRLFAIPPQEFLDLRPPDPTAGTATRRGSSDATGPKTSPEGDMPARDDRASLALGLLIMYVRELALTRRAPPTSLLFGEPKRIKSNRLAALISEFAEARTDQVADYADARHGAKVETLRKQLSAAAGLFSNSTSAD